MTLTENDEAGLSGGARARREHGVAGEDSARRSKRPVGAAPFREMAAFRLVRTAGRWRHAMVWLPVCARDEDPVLASVSEPMVALDSDRARRSFRFLRPAAGTTLRMDGVRRPGAWADRFASSGLRF